MSAVAERSFFARHWYGEARLSSAYWLVGWVGGLCVRFFNATLLASFGPTEQISHWQIVTYFLVSTALRAAHLVFGGVSIVRCAPNVNWKPWGVIAQAVVALWATLFLYNTYVML